MKTSKTNLILINLIIFLILFFILDISTYYRRLYMSNYYAPPFEKVSYISHITRDMSRKQTDEIMFKRKDLYRPVENKNSKKKPIVLFGCSFIQGHKLNDNQTVSYKLGKYTGRPIYNRASGGWGTQHMLYQLRSDKFYKQVPQPEYVIYTYIEDHINRIHVCLEPVLYGGLPTFVYLNFYNKLIYNPMSITFRFPSLSFVKEGFYYKYTTPASKANLLKLHILDSKKEIDKHWPGTKFVVFIYEPNYEIVSIADELRKNGIQTCYFRYFMGSDNNDPRYTTSQTDTHPNAEAWTVLVPKLVKYLDNYGKDEVRKNIICEKKLFNYYLQTQENSLKNYSIKELLTNREYASTFSICSIDRNLINKGDITESAARNAYFIWCIGNLFQGLHIYKPALLFNNIAIRHNPKNQAYISQGNLIKTLIK